LKLVVLQSRPGRSREVISERTFEIKHRSIHSNRTGSGMSHSVVKEQASCLAGKQQRIQKV
jgi:hypothetical protein